MLGKPIVWSRMNQLVFSAVLVILALPHRKRVLRMIMKVIKKDTMYISGPHVILYTYELYAGLLEDSTVSDFTQVNLLAFYFFTINRVSQVVAINGLKLNVPSEAILNPDGQKSFTNVLN